MRHLSRVMVGVTAATVATAVCVAAAPSGQAAEGDIPILGQTLTMGGTDSGDPAVVTVHGVRRTPKTTMVYWSITMPQNTPVQSGLAAYYISGLSGNRFNGGANSVGDVALIDQGGGLIYLPAIAHVDGYLCVCPDRSAPEFFKRGQAGILFSGVSPLPADVKTVDVVVADQIIPNVPVQDGLMEPTASEEYGPWILGMGWPPIDPQLLATATGVKPQPVNSQISDITNTVTTSKARSA